MVCKATEFPHKLLQMLNEAEEQDFAHIVSWLPNQKSFRVHQPKEFAASTMTRYFINQTKYKSFLKQLNMWGFVRIEKRGCPSHGGYKHKYLSRATPSLCFQMTRRPKPKAKRQQTFVMTNKVMNRTAHQARVQPLDSCLQNELLSAITPPEPATLKITDHDQLSWTERYVGAGGCLARDETFASDLFLGLIDRNC